jgi:hypothetical protein
MGRTGTQNNLHRKAIILIISRKENSGRLALLMLCTEACRLLGLWGVLQSETMAGVNFAIGS